MINIIILLTLDRKRRFEFVEVRLDVSVGTDVGRHTGSGGERWRGVARYGTMLVAAPHPHVLLELAASILWPPTTLVGRKLPKVLVGLTARGGVWRSGLPHDSARTPCCCHRPCRAEHSSCPTHRLLRWVLSLETRPAGSIPTGILLK